jgi:hypothetical protein
MSATPDGPLQRLNTAIPVLMKLSGAVGFVSAQVLWLGFSRPEPEFMGICVAVAAGGYVTQGLAGLRAPSPPPPTPPVEPPALEGSPAPPAPAPDSGGGET